MWVLISAGLLCHLVQMGALVRRVGTLQMGSLTTRVFLDLALQPKCQRSLYCIFSVQILEKALFFVPFVYNGKHFANLICDAILARNCTCGVQ
jgi:hypothetical protein